ncbi:DnaD domain protein [Clostridium sp. CM027]|uniref:DnaD domain-containing protein n=1 Tax=Clostridium sp. CM027 TaxID=2849865 RepID=UPI001C6F1593|nr:DnaD domain protein [Clostridium sp. CM027]MBW9145277.1 DnaD domain protein [Clostridium sp. CM027]
MAKYRQIYTEFWSDSFVFELTPEEKYFYLYLISNTKTTQCGIYEISKKFIATETGYNRDTVDKLIKRFCEYNKILYCDDTKEIMLLNWMKYNVPNNINAIKCVHHELSRVKNKEFLKILFKRCDVAQLDVAKIFENLIIEESFDINFTDDRTSVNCYLEKVDNHPINLTLERGSDVIPMENIEDQDNNDFLKKEEIQEPREFIINKDISRGLQGPYKGLPSNRIRSNKEELINKEQELINIEEEVLTKEEALTKKEAIVIKYRNNSAADGEGLKSVLKVFEENVHAITPLVYEKILDFAKQVSSKVIIMAIDEAVEYNAKTIKYITKVLNSWISKGIKTAEQVKFYQKQWASKKSGRPSHNVKNGGFCDYDQRTYDFDLLEKQLLGQAY